MTKRVGCFGGQWGPWGQGNGEKPGCHLKGTGIGRGIARGGDSRSSRVGGKG